MTKLINDDLDMLNKDRQWAKRLIWVVLAGALLFFSVRAYYRLTDDFRLSNITYELPHHAEWEIQPLGPFEKGRVEAALDQPYRYIGKGAQSYAFLSRDGNYVIKFFKFKHLKPSWLVESLPNISVFESYKAKKNLRKERLVSSVFKGYKLAYDLHREQSGLLFIHLNKTSDLKKEMTLFDKIGRAHRIDLDSTIFVLQERAKTTRDVVEEALAKGNLPLAQQRIDQIIALYLSEYRKGIYDRDHGLMHNTGFVGEKAIHLDVGKMTREQEMEKRERYLPDLEILGKRFEEWLKVNFPEYSRQVIAHFEETVYEKTGESIKVGDP